MRWNDIAVSRKLAISMIGLLMAMAGVATATLLYSSRAMESAMSAVRDHDQRIVNAVRWLGVAELSTERMVASVNTNDGDLVMQYEKAVAEGLQRMDAIHKEIAARPISAQSATTLHKLSIQQTELLALLAKASAMSNSGDVGGLRTLVAQTFHPAIATYLQLLRDFATLQEAERDAVVAQAQALRQTIGFLAFASALFLLLTASGIVVAITRSISHPLQYAVQVAEDIARGRLAQAIVSDRRDEFGRLLQALERMATQLHRVVSEVRSGIDSVSLASAEIASGNLDLSQRTEQTASSLQQTAASVEELTSTVSQSADTAHQANQMATRAVDLATQGGEVMHRAVNSMERITQSSRKIADIIGVIDGISFQTNILALNAAVEAARAGEQGRGFAVVAAEVRNLAQRSAVAAKEIGTLIQTSADAVKDGVQQVNDTGGAMLRIVEGVKGVSSYLGEITSAANAQRNGLGQINSAVANLDQMTQQNAALVEEAAAAAASLRDQAQRLTEVVSIFDLRLDPTLRLKRPLALGV